MKNEYKIVAGKNVDARHAGEKWTQMDGVKIVVSETGCEDVEWTQVLQGTVLIAAPQIILDWQEICNFTFIFTWKFTYSQEGVCSMQDVGRCRLGFDFTLKCENLKVTPFTFCNLGQNGCDFRSHEREAVTARPC
jgi:hypothetical protein